MTKKVKTLAAFSWNVNGIRAVDRKGSFKDFFEQHDPDIFCLQEIKANVEQIEETPTIGETFQKYFTNFNPAEKKGYSGTAIFSKEKPLKVVNNFPEAIASKYVLKDSFGDTNNEGRVLTCEFEKFFVVTMYTPNSKGDLSRLPLRYKNWDSATLEYMNKLQKKKPVLLCGDLNVAHKEIDLANPKANVKKHGFTPQEREGFDDFVEAGYIDTFRHFYPDVAQKYSWWSHYAKSRERNVGWRIDYWLASQSFKDKLVSAQIHDQAFGSDHCPVSVEVDISSL